MIEKLKSDNYSIGGVQIKHVIDLLLEACNHIVLLLTNLFMFLDTSIFFFIILFTTLISLRIIGLDNLASVRLPTVVEGLQRRKQSKRRPEMTGQTPSDEKVSMEFQMFWKFLFKRFLTLFGSDRSFI